MTPKEDLPAVEEAENEPTYSMTIFFILLVLGRPTANIPVPATVPNFWFLIV